MEYTERINKIFEVSLGKKILGIKKATTGLDNHVFFIQTGSEELVIRFAEEDFSSLSAHEYALSQWGKLGVPVPKVIERGKDYVVETKVRGVPLQNVNLNTLNIKNLLSEMGLMLKKMHMIKGRGFGYLNEKNIGECVTWEEAMEKYISKRLKEMTKNGFIKPQTSQKVDLFLKENFHLVKISHPVLIHKDFNDGNILIDNGSISAIIDASDVMSGDPMFDVGSVFESFEEKYFPYFIKMYGPIDTNKVLFYGIINALRAINTFGVKNCREQLRFHEKRLNELLKNRV